MDHATDDVTASAASASSSEPSSCDASPAAQPRQPGPTATSSSVPSPSALSGRATGGPSSSHVHLQPNGASAPSVDAAPRPHTRSRSGIIKKLERTDGTVTYACQLVHAAVPAEPSTYVH
jgi:hypothetical protein